MSGVLRCDGGNPWRDEDLLRELYLEEGMSANEIADELDCAASTVLNWLHRHDITVRTIRQAHGVKYGNHAKYTIDNRGYPIWWCDGSTKKSGMQVHRLLAVAEFGYDEVAGNDVHHKNGVRWDNRPSNLEVVSRSDHMTHHKTKMTWLDKPRAAEMYRGGASTYDIAEAFDVAPGTISRSIKDVNPNLMRDRSEAGSLAWEKSEVPN